jgi:hypothetical protein
MEMTMKFSMLVLLTVFMGLEGCAMFSAWKSIPPPGGCDQCHTVAINTNWQISYKVVTIADERGRQAFQTPEYNMVTTGNQVSPSERKKVEELQCFECHKAPTPAHRERKGRFHH